MIMSMFISIAMTYMVMIIFQMLAKKTKNMKQKSYEFECGFNSISMGRMPFSTQFFMLTILFLIFDLEITLMLPISLDESNMVMSNISMSILLFVLLLGLMMEWLNGMMEWTK